MYRFTISLCQSRPGVLSFFAYSFDVNTLPWQRVSQPQSGYYSLSQAGLLALNIFSSIQVLLGPGAQLEICCKASSHFYCWGILLHHYLEVYHAPLPQPHGNLLIYILLLSIAILSSFTIFTLNIQTISLAPKSNPALDGAIRHPT